MNSSTEQASQISTWRCDTCGGAVGLRDDYVIWDSQGKNRDFRIIHQAVCDDKDLHSSLPLADLVGTEGLASLMSLLTVGPLPWVTEGFTRDKDTDLSDFADLVRRLHVPNYERARPYFDDPLVKEFVGDWNEKAMYMPDELARIVEVATARAED
jgi:hypothetical protein